MRIGADGCWARGAGCLLGGCCWWTSRWLQCLLGAGKWVLPPDGMLGAVWCLLPRAASIAIVPRAASIAIHTVHMGFELICGTLLCACCCCRWGRWCGTCAPTTRRQSPAPASQSTAAGLRGRKKRHLGRDGCCAASSVYARAKTLCPHGNLPTPQSSFAILVTKHPAGRARRRRWEQQEYWHSL